MISVTKDKEGSSGLISQRIRNITHLESDGDYVVIFMSTGEKYYVVGALKHWVHTLNHTGEGHRFVVCDRANAVNLDQIVCLDTIFRRAYFTQDIGPRTISCSMSVKKFELIHQELLTCTPTTVPIHII